MSRETNYLLGLVFSSTDEETVIEWKENSFYSVAEAIAYTVGTDEEEKWA
ncbi:MAG: hypothetical protein GX903_11875 [Spirochaetales bacterium]|nr:hypothetical protein [Spirochaetales bacterium]